jgi:hypothetical protein
MQTTTRMMLAGAALVLAAAVVPAALASPAPRPAPAPAAWQVVASPNPGGSAVLFGVTAASPTSFWAVGASIRPDNSPRPLVARNTHSGWRAVSVAGLARTPGRFAAVHARAPRDIWAVGAVVKPALAPLVAHFDGRAWRQVATPALPKPGFLAGVSALSSTDAWAVGSTDVAPGGTAPLIEHWNGHAWKVVPGPSPDQFSALSGVVALSASDVWAVGKQGDEFVVPLVEHWNGHVWSVVPVPLPSPRPELCGLTAVTALSANDIWAVGQGHLVEHWDGHVWRIVPAPAASRDPDDATTLTGVSARSAKDIWAVGSVTGSPGPKTVIEHWDGKAWTLVSSPTPGTFGSFLTGVAGTAHGPTVAVGYQLGGPQSRSLILRNPR